MTADQNTVIILATRSETSCLLINYLAERFPIARVIFEARHTGKMLRRRLGKLGARTVAGQLAFLLYDRLVIRRQSRPLIDALLAGHDTRPPDGRIPVTEVGSVNDDAAQALITQLAPRVVVVSGTSIISKKTLALAPTWLNIHCGITPRYRGVHGAFWAIWEGRPDLAGVTVHQIDTGVDTGGIVAQAPITVEASDTYRTLPVKQYLAGLDLMAAAVQSALDETLDSYQRSDLDSQQWYSPTPRDYWRFLHQLRRLKTTLRCRD